LVLGLVPGYGVGARGTELIRYSNSHAWVEVYFPGYGWISFDPTGGGVGRLTALPAGPPLPSAQPTPQPSRAINEDEERDPIQRPGQGGDVTPQTSGGIVTPGGPLVIFGLLLLIVGFSAAIVARRRSRAQSVQPDAVYSSIARLASRVGFGPRPQETVYEFTGALAQVIPTHRPDLQLVADAKVEVAYGRGTVTTDRLAALRDAQRRLRLRILRLALHRGRGRDR
jgi:hypothetical protein